MTRRTPWPVQEDSGGPASSRAEAGSPRTRRASRRRTSGGRRPGDGRLPGDADEEGGLPSQEGEDGPGEETGDGETAAGGAEALPEGADDGTPDEEGKSPPSRRGQGRGPEQDPAERARAICLRLLTGTPRTRAQLADALRKREIPDEVAEEVLSRFEEVGLIDDVAFADAWVESRHHSRGLARRALARELRTKGVEPQVVENAVGQLDSEREAETARALVEGKLRSTRGLDREKRIRRLAGMLARRGYGEGLALRVVRKALEEEGEDPEALDSYLPDE